MARKLVIVESPSKAKTIEKILGVGYEVIASVGHVIDLPKTSIGIDIKNDFKPNYKVIKEKKELLNHIKDKAKKSEKVFLASDLDREGEAIAWHISNYIGKNENVKRIEFNEITKSAIVKAIKKPRDINMNLVNSQQARRLLDRIVGYKISPLLWNVVGKKASAGRVQSVALKLICELEDEILNFIEKKYFEVSIKLKYDIILELSKIDDEKVDRIYDEKIVNKLEKDLENSKVKIVEVKISNKSQKPPVVFKTSTMQQLASSKLGFNASKTMKVAQKLYEGMSINGESKGLITYMRTDSIRVSEEAKQMAKEYIMSNYSKEYVGNYTTSKTKKNIQDAHEGIRPTDINLTPEYLKSYLSNDEYRLYKLIWERFLVSQFSNMKYIQMQIIAKNKNYEFKGNLNKITFDGYYKIFKDEDEIETKEFPDIKENDEYNIEELLIKDGITKPPTRYTEATLIKKLEALGIGRPSTYASIIEAIKTKEYVEIKDKKIYPTVFGKDVKKELDNNFKNIMNVKFTAKMEDDLDEIAIGELNWVDLLKTYYNKLELEIEEYKEKKDELKTKKIYTDVKCSNIDGYMLLKSGNFGKYLVCEFDEKDKYSIKGIELDEKEIESGKVFISDKLSKNLETKKGIKTDVYTDSGSQYYLKEGRYSFYLESENYKEDNKRMSLSKDILSKIKKNLIKIENETYLLKELIDKKEKEDMEILQDVGKCELCNSPFVIKTGRYGKFLACSAYPNCKNIKKINKKK